MTTGITATLIGRAGPRPGAAGRQHPIRVVLEASDPISLAGLTTGLTTDAGFFLREAGPAGGDVAVLALRQFSLPVISRLCHDMDDQPVPIVLVVDDLSVVQLVAAVRRRVVAVLPRAAYSPPVLVRYVRTAATGGGIVPPSMLGALLQRVAGSLGNSTHDPGSDLSARELNVLRLLAAGADSDELAVQLHCSVRTAKHVTAAVVRRLKAHNRPHAVAAAIRSGII